MRISLCFINHYKMETIKITPTDSEYYFLHFLCYPDFNILNRDVYKNAVRWEMLPVNTFISCLDQ